MTRSASLRSVLFLSIGLVTNANAQSFEQRAQVYMDSTYYADTTMVGLLVHGKRRTVASPGPGSADDPRKAVRHCSRRHRS
ncbi:MAG: hypothetical protein IPI72_02500 [Flavobacteriales bacterium]|nr:hypothetical protein [Flavobacteriales bacterium]